MQSKQKLDSILTSLREYARPLIGKKTLLQLIMKSVNTMNPYPYFNLLEAYGIVKRIYATGILPDKDKTYKILLDSIELGQISVKPQKV